MSDYVAKIIDMPPKIHSFVTQQEGHETIVINARLSFERQLECYMHEIRHIENDDFEKDNVQEIELNAHKR